MKRFLPSALILIVVCACGGRNAEALFDQTSDASPIADAAQATTADAAAMGEASADAGEPAEDSATPGDTGVADAPARAPDDPCPAHVDVDCSESCGGRTPSCAEATCAPMTRITLRAARDLPFVMRTPSAPGIDAQCVAECGAHNAVFGMAVRIDDPYITRGLRARVASPWRISRVDPLHPYCFAPPPATCLATTDKLLTLLVATDDPSAPARNVVFEDTTEGCP